MSEKMGRMCALKVTLSGNFDSGSSLMSVVLVDSAVSVDREQAPRSRAQALIEISGMIGNLIIKK